VRRSSEYFVYDPELKARLVTGRADVTDWLKEHMGVDRNIDLTVLFQDAIGVPQGLLTAAFQLRPSDRKPTFDRLLQVQDYESAHKKLKDTLDHMKVVISDTDKRIAVLRTRIARLPTLRDQAQSLQREVHASAGRLAELAADLEQVTARRTALTEVKQALDQLTETIRHQETQLDGLTNLLAEARLAADQAVAAQAALEDSRPGYDAYNRVRQALDELENQRRERDRQRDLAARHERNRDLAAAEVDRLTTDLNQAVEAAAQVAALTPQVERQAALEQQLREAHEQVQTCRLLETQAAEREKQLAEAQARLAAIERDLAASQEIEAALANNRAQRAATRQSQIKIAEQQAALKAEAERLKAQSASLEAAAAATCPVCEQPLTEHHRQELLARNQTQIETLRAEYRTLNHEAAAATQHEKELEAEGPASSPGCASCPDPPSAMSCSRALKPSRPS
jgi:exonuclease SbcC